jgi:membrane-bound ClpP family serine protease
MKKTRVIVATVIAVLSLLLTAHDAATNNVTALTYFSCGFGFFIIWLLFIHFVRPNQPRT